MRPRTTIIPLSQTKFDSVVYESHNRHYSYAFWEEATVSSFRAVLFERIEEDRRDFKAKIRKSKAIIQSMFLDREQDCMTILMTSVNPIHDIATQLGICIEEAYRRVNYLRRVMAELYTYFDRRTYKRADEVLRRELSQRDYHVLSVVVRARDALVASKILGLSHDYVWKRVKEIGTYLRKQSYVYTSIKDLFVTWKRIGKIRKTYYGSRKLTLHSDLDKE